MKKFINNIVAKFGYKISRLQSNTRNVEKSSNIDSFLIQKKLISDSLSDIIIFDVGAYVGSVATIYSNLFPNSQIFCFEPFPDSFSMLIDNTKGSQNINCFNLGLSDSNGNTQFQINQSAPTNSILKTDPKSAQIWDKGLLETKETVAVETVTLDDFVAEHNIKKIDILKLDVQGAEFMVLNGAANALRQGFVRMIYTEIIILPTYQGQKSFDEVIKLICSFGFELFNFYNYSTTTAGQLRQVDALFVRANRT